MNLRELSQKQTENLLAILKLRFEKNMHRHNGIEWAKVQAKLTSNKEKLWSLNEMEATGGEPDLVSISDHKDEYTCLLYTSRCV